MRGTMASTAVTVVSTLSAGGFALLGAGFADWRARRREHAAFKTESALELAGMERLVWGDDWVELQAHMERQRARMTVARVPNELIEAFDMVSLACWHERQDNRENCEHGGISVSLLTPRRLIYRAIRAHLLDEDNRGVLQREALASVRQALPEETD